jgi:hypothetical protein
VYNDGAVKMRNMRMLWHPYKKETNAPPGCVGMKGGKINAYNQSADQKWPS